MNVHIITPYSLDKNLGRAYNESMALLPEDDWACLMDYDAMLLTPDAGAILHEYASRFPDHPLLTCYTNRVHPYSQMQLLDNTVNEDSDIRNHIRYAQQQKKELYRVTPINRDVSGVLMLMSKKQWREMPFTEEGKCLGIDSDYSKRLREAGKLAYRMDGLYIFHIYRMGFPQGIKDKRHLI